MDAAVAEEEIVLVLVGSLALVAQNVRVVDRMEDSLDLDRTFQAVAHIHDRTGRVEDSSHHSPVVGSSEVERVIRRDSKEDPAEEELGTTAVDLVWTSSEIHISSCYDTLTEQC